MSEYDVIIKGGNLVLPEAGIVNADVGIRGEKIVCLGTNLATDGAKVIDAAGKSVFPGLIDPHVHVGQFLPLKEDLLAESKGAAAGGVTTMLSTLRVLSDPGGSAAGQKERTLESYREFFPKARRVLEGPHSYIDYSWHFCPGSLEEAERADEYYQNLGIQSYKFYMAYTRRMASPGMNSGQLYAILKMWAKLLHQPLAMMHCESDEIIMATPHRGAKGMDGDASFEQALTGSPHMTSEKTKESGITGLAAWNAARPNFAEELAIRTACLLAERAGARLYIVHISTKEGVEAVAEAQHKGIRIIGETCPHYLSLTDDSQSTFGKVNPPIRKQADIDALWEGIERKVVTCVGTDHVAGPNKGKTDDIWSASLAFPVMEHTLAVMITQAIKRGIPLTKVAELCAQNNAKTFGLLPKKGIIAVGSDADLVVVDLKQRKTIVSQKLWSAAKYTPFEGMECTGWPVLTMLRGKVIFKDNQIISEPRGNFVPIYPK